jgi:heptosyltransferase-3
MSALINLAASMLQRYGTHQPRENPPDPRILVIRRNRMGDMIYTLPLLHELRRQYPNAYLGVACDPPGAAIAQACDAVNEVIVLQRGGISPLTLLRNAVRLQNFDWVIAAKGGFDRRLETLSRLTNAARRIGFVPEPNRPTLYTDRVALPADPINEHQIETLLRLLRPLGVVPDDSFVVNLKLTVPESSREFAQKLLAPFSSAPFMLINLSSTVPLKFGEDDFVMLISRVLTSTELMIGLVAAPADQVRAAKLAEKITSARVVAMATPGPLDLAALLQKSVCLFTPEGGAAHLAAAMETPAVILWSEGPFEKWHSRGSNHYFVRAEKDESIVPVERIWQALQPLLAQKK